MSVPAAKPVYLVDASSDPVVVRVDGRACFQNSGCLRDFISELLRQGRRRFVLDLQNCVSMDSTFLGVLAGAALGLIAGGLGHALWQRMNPSWFRPAARPQWLLALLLGATAYTLGTEPLDFVENGLVQRLLLGLVLLSLLAFAAQVWRAHRDARA